MQPKRTEQRETEQKHAYTYICFFFFPDQGMGAVYFNKGENCIAAGRLFVEESIHDEFVSKVVRHSRTKVEADTLLWHKEPLV